MNQDLKSRYVQSMTDPRSDGDFKYEIGDYSKHCHPSYVFPNNEKIAPITERYEDFVPGEKYKKNRYRIHGLWYDETEIDLVTPEQHPELFI